MSKGKYSMSKQYKKKLERVMNDEKIKKKPKNFYEDQQTKER